MSEDRTAKLLEIFKSFDFGYDVDVRDSDDWKKISETEYIKKVYLECIENYNHHENELYVKFFPQSTQEQYVYCLNAKGEKVGSYNL